jgi:spore maturation protein CgeB
MKIVIFGLTISSSWGNGHATLWRGLCRALARMGHRVVFFERDVPYYAAHRDCWQIPNGELILYPQWSDVRARAMHEIADADAAITTSYCIDAVPARDLILNAPRAVRVFYDLDTPVTLSQLESGAPVFYVGPEGLGDFDLVLSFTGGRALDALRDRLGARMARPLYGHVDPDTHTPNMPRECYQGDLSYLGTYAADRQDKLKSLLLGPSAVQPERRFVIGGAQYPQEFPWLSNIYFVQHLPPAEHPSFFCSSRFTLNITRKPMAAMGWCPSGRLFEAAACGAAMISDAWEGLEAFFTPEQEIIVADTAGDVVEALDMSDADIARLARAARERVLAEHTSAHRAAQLIAELEAAQASRRAPETLPWEAA